MKQRQINFVALSGKGERFLEGENLRVGDVGGENGVFFGVGKGAGDIDAKVVGRKNQCRKPFARAEGESDPHHVSSLHLLLLHTLHRKQTLENDDYLRDEPALRL